METGAESTVTLKRDVKAIQIPSGSPADLKEGMEVVITQSLGGSHTVAALGGLFRIDDSDADALGMESSGGSGSPAVEGETLEDRIWAAMKSCYDPEIPVNIVDLGLIYSMELKEGQVGVKMTLTAPGCGMGPAIAADAKSKIEALDGVDAADVEVVWEPQWNPSMISAEGKQKLGIED